MTVLLVAVAGAVGAPARFVTDAWITNRYETRFPWGTFVVNVVGSVVFGLLVGLQHADALRTHTATVLGTGFCGAFTTFSTHAVESVRLAEDGKWRLSAYNVLGTLVSCLLGAAIGFGLAELA
jgi:CrcB protein